MALDSFLDSILERYAILTRYSKESDHPVRRLAYQAIQQTVGKIAEWMLTTGMSIQYDEFGNLVGRYEGRETNSKTLLLGSCFGTGQNASHDYDILSVLLALACVERLHTHGQRLAFAIEVFAFPNEGSTHDHSLCNVNRFQIEKEVNAYGEEKHDIQIPFFTHWRPEDLLGYCEIHIERNSGLKELNVPATIVWAINSYVEIALRFTQKVKHSGTVVTSWHGNALYAAAEFILATEEFAQTRDGLFATVGQVNMQSDVGSTIQGQVTLSLDMRHQEHTFREQAHSYLYDRAKQISVQRQVALDWQIVQEHPTLLCAPRLVNLLKQAIEKSGYPVLALSNDAGYNSMLLSKLTNTCILLVRGREKTNHPFAELVTKEDMAVTITILEHFLAYVELASF